MKIADAGIMKKIDSFCINELGIPGVVLMENAALKIIKNIDMEKFNSFVIVCGKGNNGGDGFAISRHLQLMGKRVELFLIGSNEGMSNDCKINYNIVKNMGLKINKVNNVEDINELRESIQRSAMTIDCIFGTGLTKKVDGIYDMVISIINENSNYILSVDVPSGFDSNYGEPLHNSVKANKTVSFELYKSGFLNYGTDKYTGEIVIEKIGIPGSVIDKFHNNEYIMDKTMIKKNLMIRDKYAYKGDYGKILILAGSKGYSGAAYMTVQGAIKSGAGLVNLCCHEEIVDILSSKLVEAMTLTYSDGEKLKAQIEKSNCIGMGPGMGENDTTFKLVEEVIQTSNVPVVLDADAINVLKDNLNLLKKKKSAIVLTPHFGEMSKITGISIEEIKHNRMKIAKDFAKEYGVILLLKGYNTIVTDGNTSIINPTGNSAMASGGMGDCLTGMISSFIGQKYKPMEAACISAYIHGYCGEKLSKDMFCVSASNILENIPFVIKELQK